jgi:hypothetical protein
MHLSLISFDLSSVFMIVSSLPLGSVELEKRQISAAVQGAAAAAQEAVGAAGQIPSFR